MFEPLRATVQYLLPNILISTESATLGLDGNVIVKPLPLTTTKSPLAAV